MMLGYVTYPLLLAIVIVFLSPAIRILREYQRGSSSLLVVSPGTLAQKLEHSISRM
jgi:hypothetical protein